MSKEISKSPEMLQKEARIKELHQQIKKERTTLKRLQTRLKNTKQEITDIQREISSAFFRNMEKMTAIQAEIVELLKACKKFKNIGFEDEEQLEMLISEMEYIEEEEEEEESFDFFQANKDKQDTPEFEEQQRAKMRDMFQEFQMKPTEEEQKNIRKMFIKLSTNFHPDKAKNDKERQDYHSLMQQINEAYQAGDIDKLLEIEKIYLSQKVVDFTNKAVTVDMLTQEMERLERDLNFIKNQVKRTSSEIKSLRQSDMGNMLTEVNRAEKYGMGLDAMTGDMDTGIDSLTQLRDTLQQCVEKGNMKPLHEMFTQQMPISPLDFLNDLEDEDFSIMDDFFDELYDEAPEPVKNPKFPIGTPVQIKRDIYHPYVMSMNLKGWQGRVSNIYKIEKKVIYVIQFDSIALRALPKDLVHFLIEDEMEFSEIEVSATDVKKVAPRDTFEESLGTYRTLMHGKQWDYLTKKEDAMMQEILLKFPEKSDKENWEFYFKENLEFPFTGRSRGYYNDRIMSKMEIKGFYHWDEENGLLVLVDKGGGIVMDHPLDDINTNDKNANILNLYNEWLEMR